MQIPMLDLKRIHDAMKPELDQAISRVMNKSTFILGEEVERFEEEFARFLIVKYAVGVGSGTDAITLSLLALGIKPGDEVITTSLSAYPTAEAILRAGAKPVYIDINPKTYNLNPQNIEKAITPRTRAIVPVHLYGLSADMNKIRIIAAKYKLPIVEDCAQAHGAINDEGRYVGTIGLTGCFSFFPSKNLGGIGDGGMVVTNDNEVAQKIKDLRNHGQKERFVHTSLGFNSRLDEIQAAVLRVKLKALLAHNYERRKIAYHYEKELINTSFITPRTPLYSQYSHVYHLYVIRVLDKRDELRAYLREKGIQTNVHYPTPLHKQPAYPTKEHLPVVEKITKQILSIPIFPLMHAYEIEYVTHALKEWRA